MAIGKVIDLVPAGETGRHHRGPGGGFPESRKEAQLSHRAGDLVVLALVTEHPGHAAAAAVQWSDLHSRVRAKKRKRDCPLFARTRLIVAAVDPSAVASVGPKT